MKILVEHEIPDDLNSCTFPGDFWGKEVCRYHVCRNRTHGPKRPMERHVPKCTLFDTWLSKPYTKCPECVMATLKVKYQQQNIE